MSKIALLDQYTINKIAAGEVVERPAAVVKELIENAMDAGANAITIEIREGGISFIRITDNGSGIGKEDISVAFKRHSTSKIKSIEDLLHVTSLGFRGEALSSIAAIAQVELVTKSEGEIIGSRYVIEGGEEKSLEEIGCPEGTTFIVRNLFYNTPARRKFLKSPTTEAGYISDLVERLAVSHPGISFKFINNNQIRLHTSGNSHLKDIVYHVYGREIASLLIEVSDTTEYASLSGFIGKPSVSRGNRNYMNYFVNGRYIKSTMINKAIEEAYKPYTMSHRYPFVALHLQIDSPFIDVNVHPTKMEIRFTNNDEIYRFVYGVVSNALKGKELIPEVTLVEEPTVAKKAVHVPEPFEKKRIEAIIESKKEEIEPPILLKETPVYREEDEVTWNKKNIEQITLFSENLLTEEAAKNHKIIGQLFSTYWIIEFQDKMFIVDQHAAHEKVLFERTMKAIQNKEFTSQMVLPPIILTLTMREEETLKNHMELFNHLGFEIEHFGGKEYSVRAVPGDLPGIAEKELLLQLIDSLVEENRKTSPEMLLEKVASMSCKAAVKGNHSLSFEEISTLMDELLKLDNPYHCPHGRPTIISMSKYEIEKKFKRIV